MIQYKRLYEYDNSDRLRVWWMEQAGDSYRAVTGLEDGKKTESGWKQAKPKNIGKANATTGEEQATSEIKSLYTKKIDSGMSYDVPDINAGTKNFEPMLAKKYEDNLPIKFPVYCQPKLDGIRCIVKKDGMFSRNGKPIVSCPHIFNELKFVFNVYPNIIFDGELYNHQFSEDFNKIASLVKKTKPKQEDITETAELAEYHIYDVNLDQNENFAVRTSSIDGMFSRTDISFNKLIKVDTSLVSSQEELDQMYQLYLTEGFEGQMVRYNDLYEHRRTNKLLKRKEFLEKEFVILDIMEGMGNWAEMAKSVLLQIAPGITCEAGIRGTQDYLRQVLIDKLLYIGTLAKVRFQNFTPEGKLRFPVVVELNRTM